MGRESFDTKLVINTICRGSVAKLDFDDQQEYYQTKREQVVYQDQFGTQIFYIDLTTQFEIADQLDTIPIYDHISVYAGIDNYTYGNVNIITSERQYEASPSWKEVVLNNTVFIGDTVLYGKEFKEVYQGKELDGRVVFYSRIQGVIAFKLVTI